MNDSQLIDRLATTDLYPDKADLPETMRADVVLLGIARRMDMDTMERVVDVEDIKPPPRKWSGIWIAAAAFAAVIIVGVAGALLARNGDAEPASPSTTTPPATTQAPTTVVPPAPIDVGSADPIQATNDQASRVTVKFAGDARALAEGRAYRFEIEVDLEGSRENAPGATVTYVLVDGAITTTGSSPGGAEVTATWDWYAEDGLLVTLRGQGIGIPDTRPQVIVRIQETATSDIVEYVMDSPAP